MRAAILGAADKELLHEMLEIQQVFLLKIRP